MPSTATAHRFLWSGYFRQNALPYRSHNSAYRPTGRWLQPVPQMNKPSTAGGMVTALGFRFGLGITSPGFLCQGSRRGDWLAFERGRLSRSLRKGAGVSVRTCPGRLALLVG